MQYFKNPKIIFVIGTVLALAVTYIFVSPEQCPDHYTQAQVDASGCIVGANIGMPFGILLAVTIWAVTIALTHHLSQQKKPARTKRK